MLYSVLYISRGAWFCKEAKILLEKLDSNRIHLKIYEDNYPRAVAINELERKIQRIESALLAKQRCGKKTASATEKPDPILNELKKIKASLEISSVRQDPQKIFSDFFRSWNPEISKFITDIQLPEGTQVKLLNGDETLEITLPKELRLQLDPEKSLSFEDFSYLNRLNKDLEMDQLKGAPTTNQEKIAPHSSDSLKVKNLSYLASFGKKVSRPFIEGKEIQCNSKIIVKKDKNGLKVESNLYSFTATPVPGTLSRGAICLTQGLGLSDRYFIQDAWRIYEIFKETSNQATPIDQKTLKELPPCDLQDKAKIHYLISTLAKESTSALLLVHLRKVLQCSKKLEHLHPLKFLEEIFKDPALKKQMGTIQQQKLKWDALLGGGGFREGIVQNLEKEARKGNILPHLKEFAKTLNTDLETLEQFAKSAQWEEMVLFLNL